MLEAHRSSAFLGPLKLLTRESRRTVSLQSPIKKWWLRLLHKGCTYNTMIEVYTVEKTRSPGWSTEIPSLPKIEGGEMRGGGGSGPGRCRTWARAARRHCAGGAPAGASRRACWRRALARRRRRRARPRPRSTAPAPPRPRTRCTGSSSLPPRRGR
jgi:hypothetical protein